MKNLKYLILILFSFILLINNAKATENSEIENFIENFSAEFEKISKLKTKKEKEDATYDLANKILDLNWIGNFILGKNRNSFDENTKKDFIKYYSKSLIKNYISFLDSYKKENYKILKIEKKKENLFMVDTEIKLQDKSVNNTFRITKKNNIYYITDIITEGISFISNQRMEIESIISNGKFDEFMEKLKKENI